MTEQEQPSVNLGMNWRFKGRSTCPACGRREKFGYFARCIEQRVEPGVIFTYLICVSCGLIFQPLIMDDITMESFYENDYRTLTSQGKRSGPLEADLLLEKRRGARILKTVTDYLKGEGIEPDAVIDSWLDVGCATGSLLEQVRERFAAADVKGVELNESTRKIAIGKGLSVVRSIHGLECQHSVVSALHVLEHIPDPYEFILSLRPHLKEGGLLLIDVPYVHGVPLRTLTFTHLQAFSKETLMAMVRRAGFKPLLVGDYVDKLIPVIPSDTTLIATLDPEYNESEAATPPKEE